MGSLFEVGDMRIFADAPGLLLAAGLRAVVGAAIHSPGYRFAEALGDFRAGGKTAGILDGVVEQGGDGLGLGPAELEHGRADGQQVRDVGNVGALAGLAGMELDRETERLL